MTSSTRQREQAAAHFVANRVSGRHRQVGRDAYVQVNGDVVGCAAAADAVIAFNAVNVADTRPMATLSSGASSTNAGMFSRIVSTPILAIAGDGKGDNRIGPPQTGSNGQQTHQHPGANKQARERVLPVGDEDPFLQCASAPDFPHTDDALHAT